MDFLAFMVQTLWPNFRKFIRRIPTNSLGISYNIRGLPAIAWAPVTPRNRSKALQIHIPA